jgi:hypothetical protein
VPITYTDLTADEWSPGQVQSVEVDAVGHVHAVVRVDGPPTVSLRIMCDTARVATPGARVAIVCVALEGEPTVRVRTEASPTT